MVLAAMSAGVMVAVERCRGGDGGDAINLPIPVHLIDDFRKNSNRMGWAVENVRKKGCIHLIQR